MQCRLMMRRPADPGTLQAVRRSLVSSFSMRAQAPARSMGSQTGLSSASGLSGSKRRPSVTFACELTRTESKD